MKVISLQWFRKKKEEEVREKTMAAYCTCVKALNDAVDKPCSMFIDRVMELIGGTGRKAAAKEVVAVLVKQAGLFAGRYEVYINEQDMMAKFRHYKESGRLHRNVKSQRR